MTVAPIPKDYHAITAQLNLEGASAALVFYTKAFGAEVVDQSPDPSGQKIWHASLRIGDSMIMVNDVFPEMGATKSQSTLWLYVADCDAVWKRAVESGATATHPPMDMFWGDRMAGVQDPFGQKWTIATRKQDLTHEEIDKAAATFAASLKNG